MSTVDVAPIFTWFRTLLVNGTGKQIGDHVSPATPVLPYAVLSAMDGVQFHGAPLVTPDADADLVFQVDSISSRPDQARWMSDLVRRTVLARDAGVFQVALADPVGYHIADRMPDGGPSIPIPEGSNANRLYTVPERFIIRVTAGA